MGLGERMQDIEVWIVTEEEERETAARELAEAIRQGEEEERREQEARREREARADRGDR